MENPYAAEAQQRWGQTEAYRQSAERTARYSPQDWERIKGEPAQGERAMDLAEEHRQHISRWFYDCSTEIHRGLGDMYVEDPRFTANYDTDHPGLAQFIRDAIHANAARA
jgi:hypothetical protein